MSDFLNTSREFRSGENKQLNFEFPKNPREVLEWLIEYHSKGFRKKVGKLIIAAHARELFNQQKAPTMDQIDAIVMQAVEEWRGRNRRQGKPFAERARARRVQKGMNPDWLSSILHPPKSQSPIVSESFDNTKEMFRKRKILWRIFAPRCQEISNRKLIDAMREAERREREGGEVYFEISLARVLLERFPRQARQIKQVLREARFLIAARYLRVDTTKEAISKKPITRKRIRKVFADRSSAAANDDTLWEEE